MATKDKVKQNKSPVKSGGSVVPTRIERIAKRVKSDITKLVVTKIPHTVIVTSNQFAEVQGFLFDKTDTTISMRHRARSGSSRQITSTFDLADVVELVGEVGGPAQVIVRQDVELRKLPGQGIQIKNGVVVAKDLKTNEVTEFRRHPGIKLLVVADDVKSPKAGADKPTGTKKSGKASNFED
jgi:hypothetical protein